MASHQQLTLPFFTISLNPPWQPTYATHSSWLRLFQLPLNPLWQLTDTNQYSRLKLCLPTNKYDSAALYKSSLITDRHLPFVHCKLYPLNPLHH